MTDTIRLFDSTPAAPTSTAVEMFDPPMCCPTGVCGPALDQTLLDVSDMILALQAEGVAVSRYQMTSQPQAFLSNAAVMQLMRERELAALPRDPRRHPGGASRRAGIVRRRRSLLTAAGARACLRDPGAGGG